MPKRKRKDLTGMRVGKLTVLHSVEDRVAANGRRRTQWLCKCDCGNESIVQTSELTTAHIKSCGCISGKLKDLTGKKFGNWTVIKRGENKYGATAWECICKCGVTRNVAATSLLSGVSQGCGCEKPRTITHGESSTRLYGIWCGMKRRCYHPHNASYKNYGAKGITVCNEWLNSYETFRDWAVSNGYTDSLTIDRIDNSRGYEPSNCRWADRKTQMNNMTTNAIINFEGVEHTVSEWAALFNTPSRIAYDRRTKGWDNKHIFDPINNKVHRGNKNADSTYYEDVLLPIILKEKERLSA